MTKERGRATFDRGDIVATKAKIFKDAGLDTYMALIHRMALKPIKNNQQHEQAISIIEELMGRELDGERLTIWTRLFYW